MIFYFTGTGNSYDAALQLAGQDEKIISITECVQNKKFTFTAAAEEKIGLVFPVYYGGVPTIVSYFVSNLKFEGTPYYLYTVITCGASSFDAGHMIARKFENQGYVLDAAYTVRMPDNYILLYEPESAENKNKALEKSKSILAEVKSQIDTCTIKKPERGAKARLGTSFMYPLYVHGRKTEKFWVDDQCVGCGVCAGRCPQKAIEMKDGKPTWVKERCILCHSCMRCGAIQYGKKTVGRERYTNPVLKKNCCKKSDTEEVDAE